VVRKIAKGENTVRFNNFDEMVRIVKERGRKKRCAVVAAESRHILEPVLAACKDGFIEPILIGDGGTIHEYVEQIAGTAGGITIINASGPQEAAQRGVNLVNEGKADCITKGRIETATFMSILLHRGNKMRTGRIVSSYGLMEIPSYHKLLANTDGGVNPFPDLRQKKEIIQNAVWALRKIGISCPKVAVLAAVEVVNQKIPATVDARALREMNERGEIRHCIIEGPISYDLAISKEAAQAKSFESPVAGDADLLVWPDINAGNITMKALICSAHMREAGFILGAKVPIFISSRSAPLENRYLSIILATLAD
jgi:phosphate butyryltransferase